MDIKRTLRKNRFTVGAAAVALLLGGYMLLVEAKNEPPADTKDITVWSLTDNQAQDLKTIVVTAGGKTATYTRDGERWHLAEKPKRNLTTETWDSAYKNLKFLTASRQVEAKAGDLKKYGLDKPETTIRWGDEKTPYAIQVGGKNPTGDANYVHVAKDGAVYTVATWKVDAWRNLAVTPPLEPEPSPSPVPSPATSASPAPSPSVSAK